MLLADCGGVNRRIGKGHLGYQTTDHLPINRGFESHTGYLSGAENYEHGLADTCDVPADEFTFPRKVPWTNPWPPPGTWPPSANTSNGMDPCQYDMWQDHAGAPQDFLDAMVREPACPIERLSGERTLRL